MAVEVTRGGADAAQLDVQSGPLRGYETLRVIYPGDVISLPDWGHGWNTTMHVRDDGTFGDDGGWRRDGREVRITGRARGGLEAYANLRVTVPAGRRVGLHWGVGKVFVTNVDGVIVVQAASADVSAERTRGTLKLDTGSGEIDLHDASGDVKLESGSGDINARNFAARKVKVSISGSGDAHVNATEALDAKVAGSGDITYSGRPPGVSWRSLSTTSRRT